MKRRFSLRALRWVIVLVLMPAAVYLCGISDRKYYLSALLVIAMTVAVFFLSFERRGPQARELALLAYRIMLRNAAVGFEAANHYYATRSNLIEKVVQCDYLLGDK